MCILSGDIQDFLPSGACAGLKHKMVAAKFPSCQPGGESVEGRVRYLAVKDPFGRKGKMKGHVRSAPVRLWWHFHLKCLKTCPFAVCWSEGRDICLNKMSNF